MYYFAYGSNLHPIRLVERVASAKLIGVTSLQEYSLAFHKKSTDGSAKCNIHASNRSLNRVHGALYSLNAEHKGLLDEYEGKGYGYTDNIITIKYSGRQYEAFTYTAQPSYIVDNLKPYDWYKQLVLLGAQYLEFPDDYISSIQLIRPMEDPDLARREEHEELIERIIKYGKPGV